ncbi:hypothetical protein ACFQY7_15295 [Actinomadura luteofluorescens]|uniref:hypothetical protein n=1 Tax=Actinomadura luteofluorescens TaxID=46163 RepID=UPI00363C27F9
MDFSSAADELYGVPPADFVETRKRLVQEAKGAGDAALAKRIGALRRPTLSAWAVNLLARSAADELTGLLDVGEEMRAAWGSGRGLGDLEQRRARLVGSLVRTAANSPRTRAAHCASRRSARWRTRSRPPRWTPESPRRSAKGGCRSPAAIPASSPPDSPWRPRTGTNARNRSPGRSPPSGSPPGRSDRPGRRRSARSNVTRTSAARARRAETLRKRAEEAEDKLAEREERADAAQREVQEASTKVGRLRHELERAIAERDAASRRADRAEQNRARAEEVAREARKAATEARRAAARDPHPGRPSSTAGRG